MPGRGEIMNGEAVAANNRATLRGLTIGKRYEGRPVRRDEGLPDGWLHVTRLRASWSYLTLEYDAPARHIPPIGC